MSVTVTLFLYSKPGQELNEGGPVTAEELRELGKTLHVRLDEAATIVEKLVGAGWDSQMGLYDVFLSHPYLNNTADVEEKLQDLGINPESVFIDEMDDEDEQEIEEEPGLDQP
jgi:hypothetical protein